MSKKIVIKEIDKLASAVHKDRIVTEYIIYVYDCNSKPLEAYTEFGEEAKQTRVNELILLHFITSDINQQPINNEDIIENISFEEYSKELKKIWKK